MIPRKKLKNRIDWIRRRRALVKDRCFYLRWSILQELFPVCMAGAFGTARYELRHDHNNICDVEYTGHSDQYGDPKADVRASAW